MSSVRTTNKFHESFKNISTISITGSDCFGKTYTNSHVDFSLTKPWTFFGIGTEITDEIKIKQDISNKNIIFSFTRNEDNNKKNISTEFKISDLEQAIKSAKLLANGESGVLLIKTINCNSFLNGTSSSILIPFQLLFGNGYGSETVEMIFDCENRLDRIKIFQNYKGDEKILFLAKNLKSNIEIKAEKDFARNQDNQMREEANKNRQFKF